MQPPVGLIDESATVDKLGGEIRGIVQVCDKTYDQYQIDFIEKYHRVPNTAHASGIAAAHLNGWNTWC